MQAVSLGGDFYDALGVGDSIVRERVFRQLETRTGIPYDTIYEAWLDAKPVPGWHPVQPPELAPHVPEEALHKPFRPGSRMRLRHPARRRTCWPGPAALPAVPRNGRNDDEPPMKDYGK